MSGITVGRVRYPDAHPLPSVFGFCAVMAAHVAHKRGGQASTYLKECFDFLTDVLGRQVRASGPLPADYDNTVAGARDTADALLEYDHG